MSRATFHGKTLYAARMSTFSSFQILRPVSASPNHESIIRDYFHITRILLGKREGFQSHHSTGLLADTPPIHNKVAKAACKLVVKK